MEEHKNAWPWLATFVYGLVIGTILFVCGFGSYLISSVIISKKINSQAHSWIQHSTALNCPRFVGESRDGILFFKSDYGVMTSVERPVFEKAVELAPESLRCNYED